MNQKAKVTFFDKRYLLPLEKRNQPMTQPSAGKNFLTIVELEFSVRRDN